jgi:beta-mannanase
MNGSWHPWAEGVNGNSAGSYVAAWRHVTGLFAAARVKNVTWTWAPAVPQDGVTSLAELYPGDAAVQRVALDGYNWGTSQTWSRWQSFGDIFGPGVAQLAALSTKPIYIGETASTELGGDKAAWISDMWAWLAQHPAVRGLTWFDFDKETDWRLDSSPSSLQAFRAGIGGFVSR